MNVQLTAAKLMAAINLIRESAISAMAVKNGMTVEQVEEFLQSGHEGALRQFRQLAAAGAQEAVKLHEEGKIELIA